MGEVLLSMELGDVDPDRREAFAREMTRRRWEPAFGVPSTWSCYFEHGLIDEVRQIVFEDLVKVTQAAGIERWQSAHNWSAIPHGVLGPSLAQPADRDARAVWTDDGSGQPVGPVSEVLLALNLEGSSQEQRDLVAATLAKRKWHRLPDLPATWCHELDLGMFDAIEDRVTADLTLAMRNAFLADWRAVWSLGSWYCDRLGSTPDPRPLRYRGAS